MDEGSKHYIGGSDQSYTKEKVMREGKVIIWGGLTNSWEKKRSERQRRKGKIYPTECRDPETARRDKNIFLGEHCKEIEKNNRIKKTRDLFKKIRDTKVTFHAKKDTIKDLTWAEEIKKKWQEYTEELYRKGLNKLDNHDGMVTYLEPDIQNVKSHGP